MSNFKRFRTRLLHCMNKIKKDWHEVYLSCPKTDIIEKNMKTALYLVKRRVPTDPQLLTQSLNKLMKIGCYNLLSIALQQPFSINIYFSAAAFSPAIYPNTIISGIALPPTRLPAWIPPVTSPAA